MPPLFSLIIHLVILLFHIYFPKYELMMTDCTGIFLLVVTKIWERVTPHKHTCQKLHQKEVFIICSTSFKAWPQRAYSCYFLWLCQKLQEIFVKSNKIDKSNLQIWHKNSFIQNLFDVIPQRKEVQAIDISDATVRPLPPFTSC